jgi:hypothetical protein
VVNYFYIFICEDLRFLRYQRSGFLLFLLSCFVPLNLDTAELLPGQTSAYAGLNILPPAFFLLPFFLLCKSACLPQAWPFLRHQPACQSLGAGTAFWLYNS